MLNIIDFLERIGRDAGLRHATSAELAEALLNARIDPFLRKAVLAGDRHRLEFVLGAQPNVCCAISLPKGDEDGEEQERKAKEGTEPEKSASAQLSSGRMALAG